MEVTAATAAAFIASHTSMASLSASISASISARHIAVVKISTGKIPLVASVPLVDRFLSQELIFEAPWNC